MAIYPTTADVKIPVKMEGKILAVMVSCRKSSMLSYTPAAKKTGTDNKKANLAAVGRSKPRSIPPVMVDPDREAPGNTANI